MFSLCFCLAGNWVNHELKSNQVSIAQTRALWLKLPWRFSKIIKISTSSSARDFLRVNWDFLQVFLSSCRLKLRSFSSFAIKMFWRQIESRIEWQTCDCVADITWSDVPCVLCWNFVIDSGWRRLAKGRWMFLFRISIVLARSECDC